MNRVVKIIIITVEVDAPAGVIKYEIRKIKK